MTQRDFLPFKKKTKNMTKNQLKANKQKGKEDKIKCHS